MYNVHIKNISRAKSEVDRSEKVKRGKYMPRTIEQWKRDFKKKN
jgi:hypothetical protein